MVASWVRTIFTMTTPELVRAQIDHVADTLEQGYPGVSAALRNAKADLSVFADFPQAPWTKIWSTNPIERPDKELKCRTGVVGIFPNNDVPAATGRLRAHRDPRRTTKSSSKRSNAERRVFVRALRMNASSN